MCLPTLKAGSLFCYLNFVSLDPEILGLNSHYYVTTTCY